MFCRIVSSCTPCPGPVEAISSRFGSGAMFAASSSASSSGGSIGLAGLGGALERAGGDVGDQGGEQAAQAALFVRRRDQVQRVCAGEQPLRR